MGVEDLKKLDVSFPEKLIRRILDLTSMAAFDVERISKAIDNTLLRPQASEAEIRRLCEESVRYGFAAVCVNPIYVPLAYELVKNSDVKVCTVIGFPLGATFKGVKALEARKAVDNGASEIDMVMNISMFKSGKYEYVEEEIREVKEAIGNKVLKVIIECCYLTDEEKIRAAKIAEKAGADYIKTSTGFGPAGAKVDDVKLLRKILSPNVKIKAAGGIRTAEQVIEFLEAGANRIGTSSGTKIIQELKQEF